MWVSFVQKRNILNKIWENSIFFKDFQNDDENIDLVDRAHQHSQSLHSHKRFSGFNISFSNIIGSLDLYAVECLMFTLACTYVAMHLQLISVSSSLVFEFGDSVFQKVRSAPPTS